MARHGLGAYAASSLVVLTAASFSVLVRLNTASGAGAGETLRSFFSSSDGLTVGSEVSVAGVKVGEVVSIKLERRSLLSEVTFTIGRRLELPDDSRLAVQSAGPSSAASLVVERGRSSVPLRDGQTVTHTSSAKSLENEIGSFIFGNGDFGESN